MRFRENCFNKAGHFGKTLLLCAHFICVTRIPEIPAMWLFETDHKTNPCADFRPPRSLLRPRSGFLHIRRLRVNVYWPSFSYFSFISSRRDRIPSESILLSVWKIGQIVRDGSRPYDRFGKCGVYKKGAYPAGLPHKAYASAADVSLDRTT
jgi:hypothetical protein